MRKLKIFFFSIMVLCALESPAVTNTHTTTIHGDNSGIIQQTEGIIQNYFNIIQKLGVDPRDLEPLLKDLPITLDQREMRKTIDQWYQEKTISADEQQALYVVTRIIANHNRALSDEITKLREEGNNDSAQFLEKIRKYFQEREPENIVAEYEKRIKQQKEENIKALNLAIEATTALCERIGPVKLTV